MHEKAQYHLSSGNAKRNHNHFTPVKTIVSKIHKSSDQSGKKVQIKSSAVIMIVKGFLEKLKIKPPYNVSVYPTEISILKKYQYAHVYCSPLTIVKPPMSINQLIKKTVVQAERTTVQPHNMKSCFSQNDGWNWKQLC